MINIPELQAQNLIYQVKISSSKEKRKEGKLFLYLFFKIVICSFNIYNIITYILLLCILFYK